MFPLVLASRISVTMFNIESRVDPSTDHANSRWTPTTFMNEIEPAVLPSAKRVVT